MKRSILVLGLVIGSIVSTLAADGIKIISTTKNLSNKAAFNTNIYITATQVALENKGGGQNNTFIFNSASEEFTYVDHAKKEYYHFDKATMQQLKQQIKMLMMMMKSFAANMPEDQKKKLDKIINNDQTEMEFASTGKSSKVGKWGTSIYEGKTKGEKATDMYIATFKAIGYSQEKFEVMQKLIQYFKSNLSEIAAFLPTGGSFSQISFDETSPVFKDGVPVKTISYENNQAKNENIVQSIKSESFSNAIFQAPTGYVRKQINMQMK
ncbi:MAG: hypothetical protein JXQ96_03030 [Cyclobacteriaceae bacterium]